jgi:polyribonucleotide nucleotidyltransferase
VAPGRRIDTVEEVLSKGDEIGVRVVEVDRERGRIGLRLNDDPDIAGKSAEELVSVGTGDPGPPKRDRGERRDGRGGRGGGGYRDRDRDRDRGRVRDRDPERPRS